MEIVTEPNDSTSKLSRKPQHAFTCPPHGTIERILTGGMLLVLTWAVPWALLGDNCLPGSNIFSLIIVIDVCTIGGMLVSIIKIPSLPPLPPLLGMLICGFCLRNIPVINVAKDIDPAWSSALRSIALTIILVKAGLELDAMALKKMKGVCLRLTAIPCLVETVTCAVACKLLLDFPWQWGFILGFVLAAVTPAVIVPSLLPLQDQGYGVKKGIPTLIIAASSFDDVLAISGFSVVLGITFSQVSNVQDVTIYEANATVSTTMTGNQTSTAAPSLVQEQSAGDLAWMILRGPVEMLAGIIIGTVIGLIMWFLPARDIIETVRDRVLLVVGLGIFVLLGSRRAGFPGTGALAAIVLAFVAATRWKDEKERISKYVGMLWNLFEPVMFGLIGAEISVDSMDPATIGRGLAVLFIGLFTRSLSSFGVVSNSGFTHREKLFVSLAWLPKATVQAAIGPVALDTARNISAPSEIQSLAKQVLTIAVLSIIVTAPLGAAAISIGGPKLLDRAEEANGPGEAKAAGGDVRSGTEGTSSLNEDTMRELVPLKTAEQVVSLP